MAETSKTAKRSKKVKRSKTVKRPKTARTLKTAKGSQSWVVTASGERALEHVAADLKRRGFKVDKVLGEIGSITGSGADDVAERARQVRGVADVSPDIPINIGPPNSRDTW